MLNDINQYHTRTSVLLFHYGSSYFPRFDIKNVSNNNVLQLFLYNWNVISLQFGLFLSPTIKIAH